MRERIKRDITIRYVPDLFSEEGRTLQSFSYDRRLSIRKYIRKAKIDAKGMVISVNGYEVGKKHPMLVTGDEIMVSPKVEGPLFAAIGAMVSFLVKQALLHPFIAWMTVLSISYSVYSALSQRVSSPSYDTYGSGIDEASPAHSWTGVRTVRETGGRVPNGYGRFLTGGIVINEYMRTNGNDNYLNSLVAIGEGKFRSITLTRINRNPVANYKGYTVETRLGTNDQTAIKNFERLHNVEYLNLELPKSSAQVHTTINDDVEAYEVRIRMPNGLWMQTTTGSIRAWAATFSIKHKLTSDPDVPGSWSTPVILTVSAESRTELKRIYLKEDLPAGQYDISVTKTSDDSDYYHTSDAYLESVDEIRLDDLTYPNTGLGSVRALAVASLSDSSPEYEFLAERIITAPSVTLGGVEQDWEDYYWDPEDACYKLFSDGTELDWDGVTYTEQFCANPVWCILDMHTNKRYGVGNFIEAADNDMDYLLEQSQYCDERVPDGKGGWEKRFRMDVIIDSPQRALDLTVQLGTVFRGMPFISDQGQIKVAIDKPGDPVQLLGMGNIIQGSFSEAWGSKSDIPNMVNVQFDNQDKYYAQETTTVIDPESLNNGDPCNPKDVRYYGTKLSYAIRHGRNVIKGAKYVTQSYKIKCGMGAIIRQCGEIVDLAHDVPMFGYSGRVLDGSTLTTVMMDRTVIIESSKSYAIRVDFADGTYEERQVTDPPGTYTKVTVVAVFSQEPAEWDSYSFGEINKVVKPARIVNLKRHRLGSVEMELQEQNNLIYDDSAIVVPDFNYSMLSFEIPPVTDLRLTEGLTKLADGTIEDRIDVWFNKPDMVNTSITGYTGAKIYLSDDAGASWVYRGETAGTKFSIIGGLTDGLTYTVAVVSASRNKERDVSFCPQQSIQLVGKSAPPEDVVSFLVNQSRDRIFFGWSEVGDLDLKGYEIRFGASWDSAATLVTNKKGNNHIELNFRIGADQKYFIAAIDTSGNYSETATEAVITVANIPFTNVVKTTSEQPAWGGTLVDTVIAGAVLKLDTGCLTGTYTTPVIDVNYVATFKIGIEEVVTVAGDRKWNDDPAARFGDSHTLRFSGEEIAGAATFRIRTSDDNVTWSAWRTWQAGDYTCRYYQLELTLTRASAEQDLECSQFNHYADLPDVDENIDFEVTNAATGFDLTFVKEYHEPPQVNIEVLDGTGVYKQFSTAPTITGCAGQIFDITGTAQTGNCRAHVHGV